MSARIGTISGTFLLPGVSRNRRWYRPEVVKAAVENMRERIASGGLPITMATSHGAGKTDDALHTAAAVREVWTDDQGVGHFKADVPNTSTGRDVIELFRGGYAGGVSIDGDWDNVRRMTGPDGDVCEAGDNLIVKRIDLTGNPGVVGAGISEVSVSEAVVVGGGRVSLHESFDGIALETVAVTEVAPESTSVAASTAPSTTGTAEAAPTKETPVAETTETKPTTEAVAPAPAELSEASVKALAAAIAESVAAAIKPAPVTETAPVAETTAPATPLTESSVDAKIAAAVDAAKAEIREQIKGATFGRRGLAPLTESTAEPKTPEDLAKMSAQELRDHMAQQEAMPLFGRATSGV